MPESEVPRFKQEQAAQERAAYLGLYGFALTARHDAIEARATRGAARILQLLEEGKGEEAFSLLKRPSWEEPV